MKKAASSLIPVIFCIDVEPDPRLITRSAPEPWTGYESIHRYLSELRPRLEEQTGHPVRYSWFFRMDPQIAESYGGAAYVVERYADFVEEIRSHGDEVGIHMHQYRWSENQNNWIHDFGKEWTAHCIGTSLEAYRQALGVSCVSYRGGDSWQSTETVNLIEQLGVKFDLTIEPGLRPGKSRQPGIPDWKFIPRYYRVPRTPYTPSELDFRVAVRPGSRSVTMIPLTSTYLAGLPMYSVARRILLNGFHNRHQDTPLQIWLQRKPPNILGSLIDRAIAAQQKPYLAFVVRADVVVKRKLLKGFSASIETLLSHPTRTRFVFCTPPQAMAMLEPQNPALLC